MTPLFETAVLFAIGLALFPFFHRIAQRLLGLEERHDDAHCESTQSAGRSAEIRRRSSSSDERWASMAIYPTVGRRVKAIPVDEMEREKAFWGPR